MCSSLSFRFINLILTNSDVNTFFLLLFWVMCTDVNYSHSQFISYCECHFFSIRFFFFLSIAAHLYHICTVSSWKKKKNLEHCTFVWTYLYVFLLPYNYGREHVNQTWNWVLMSSLLQYFPCSIHAHFIFFILCPPPFLPSSLPSILPSLSPIDSQPLSLSLVSLFNYLSHNFPFSVSVPWKVIDC